MAYWNSVYPAQEPIPYNYVPNGFEYVQQPPRRPPPQESRKDSPKEAAGSCGCIVGTIVIVLFVIAAFVIPITLALTNTGPFSTTSAPENSTTTTTTTISTTTTTSISTSTTIPPWSQCSSYVTINDSTRLTTSTGGSLCDTSTFTSNTTWVRFLPPGGTQIVTSNPNTNRCGTQATGWYNGTMPSVGMTVNGTVCYSWSAACTWMNAIQVTNCGGFYVYGLIAPPGCNFRYCTA